MSSSDSGEDFESADEDFDVDNSSKYTERKSEHVEKEVKVVEFSSKDSDKTLPVGEFSGLLIKEDQNTIKLDNNVSNSTEDNSIVDKNTKVKKSDDSKIKPSKKLGTRLSGNIKHGDSLLSNLSNKPEDSKEKSEYAKISEMKIAEENKTNENIKSTVNLQSTQSVELKGKTHSLPIKNIESEYKSSDGWEVEEEDWCGNISMAFAKSADETIKNNNKQVVGLYQIKHSSNEHEDTQEWGGWGGWGVSSLISTATDSVSTFSSQVTAGLSTVLETTVGAPDPETLAATSVRTAERTEDPLGSKEDKIPPGYSGFGSLVSGVSFVSSTVINRGLDTLESLGKKTMEVLQEGDPGLMKKRVLLFPSQDKPVLSQILHEAKEKAEHSDKEKEEKETARKAHFESIFDDFHGMVHLEALKMLSTQCELKLQSQMQSLSGDQLTDFQETLAQVKDLCELSEEEEDIPELTQEQFAEHITRYMEGLKIQITAAKIIHVNSEVITRMDRLKTEPATTVHQTAISSVAEFTAAAMECFHKSAELLLAKIHHNTPEEAESYVQLTNLLSARASAITNEFTQLLTKKDPIANSSIITNIFLESSSSCIYISNACQLLVPILQVGAFSS